MILLTVVIGKGPRKLDIQWIGSGMDNTMGDAQLLEVT